MYLGHFSDLASERRLSPTTADYLVLNVSSIKVDTRPTISVPLTTLEPRAASSSPGLPAWAVFAVPSQFADELVILLVGPGRREEDAQPGYLCCLPAVPHLLGPHQGSSWGLVGGAVQSRRRYNINFFTSQHSVCSPPRLRESLMCGGLPALHINYSSSTLHPPDFPQFFLSPLSPYKALSPPPSSCPSLSLCRMTKPR
jgi:hypothetical protein